MATQFSTQLAALATGTLLTGYEQDAPVRIASAEFATGSSGVTTADTLNMIKLPAGVKILDGVVRWEAMGAGAKIMLGLAGADGNGYIDAAGSVADDADHFLASITCSLAGYDTFQNIVANDLNLGKELDKACYVTATVIGSGSPKWAISKTLQMRLNYAQH